MQKKKINKTIPVAHRIRPTKLEDVVGQTNLLKKNSALFNFCSKGDIVSSIFWGPPGCGKTTVAKIILKKSQFPVEQYSATFSSISLIKKSMQAAKYRFDKDGIPTIFFIDEIHRFNRAQQDPFLSYIEEGSVILLGITTQNPSFEINSALLSRCVIFIFDKLTNNQVKTIVERAINIIFPQTTFEKDLIDFIVFSSSSDARVALNSIELISSNFFKKQKRITLKMAESLISKKEGFYDKNRDYHYNFISAFHKAIRGSDTQAALYWLAKMIHSGEDPKYITRRLIRIASEDIGLAEPNALVQAASAMQAVTFIGLPECDIILAQVTVYLSNCPKSNRLYLAINSAKKAACKTRQLVPPLSICNAPTNLMKKIGYSKGYKYSHNYKNSYSYQKYFPDEMKEELYYLPSDMGFEKEIKKRMKWWEKLKNQK